MFSDGMNGQAYEINIQYVCPLSVLAYGQLRYWLLYSLGFIPVYFLKIL